MGGGHKVRGKATKVVAEGSGESFQCKNGTEGPGSYLSNEHYEYDRR